MVPITTLIPKINLNGPCTRRADIFPKLQLNSKTYISCAYDNAQIPNISIYVIINWKFLFKLYRQLYKNTHALLVPHKI